MLFTVMLDLVLTALSCGVILHSVARLASQEEWHWALQTCTSQLYAVLLCARGVAVLGALHWEACPIFCPPFLWPISTSFCLSCLTHSCTVLRSRRYTMPSTIPGLRKASVTSGAKNSSECPKEGSQSDQRLTALSTCYFTPSFPRSFPLPYIKYVWISFLNMG